MVIARNSTFAFKDRPTDIREVGARLGARYVVEGSTRRAGDQLRVVAQLIDAETGVHLWSQSYDRRVADVFAVQTDVTRQIVAALVSYVRRFGIRRRRPGGRPNRCRPTSWCCRAARSISATRPIRQRPGRRASCSPGRWRSIPAMPTAHAQLGLMDIVEHMNGVARDEGGGDLAAGLAQAREAIRLEPDLALAYQVLSYGLAESGDYQGGLQAAERAVELNASDPDSLMALAKAQVRFGSYDAAVANAALARRLHPMAPDYYAYVHGQALYAAGREDEARQVMDECLLDVPRERNCLRTLAVALVRLDRVAEAQRGHGPAGRTGSDLLRGGRAAAASVRQVAADGALPRRPRRRRGACRPEPGGHAAPRGRRLGRPLLRQPQLRRRLRAQHEFLHLAGDRGREAVDEADVARDLVVGDAAVAEGADLGLGGGGAVLEHDRGAQLLAELLVRHAEALHVLDRWVGVEELLDLAGIDVLAAADHHVLDPADDVAEALGVDDGEVAGVHPAGGVDRLGGAQRVVPVAAHDRVAAGAQLAGEPARDDAAVLVDQLDLEMRVDAADGGDAAVEAGRRCRSGS